MFTKFIKMLFSKIKRFWRRRILRKMWWNDTIEMVQDRIKELAKEDKFGGIGSGIFLANTNVESEMVKEIARSMPDEAEFITKTNTLGLIALPEEDDYEKHRMNVGLALQGSKMVLNWQEAMVVQDVYYLTKKDEDRWRMVADGVPLSMFDDNRSALIFNRLEAHGSNKKEWKNWFGITEYRRNEDGTIHFDEVVWQVGQPPADVVHVELKKRCTDMILPQQQGEKTNGGQD